MHRQASTAAGGYRLSACHHLAGCCSAAGAGCSWVFCLSRGPPYPLQLRAHSPLLRCLCHTAPAVPHCACYVISCSHPCVCACTRTCVRTCVRACVSVFRTFATNKIRMVFMSLGSGPEIAPSCGCHAKFIGTAWTAESAEPTPLPPRNWFSGVAHGLLATSPSGMTNLTTL